MTVSDEVKNAVYNHLESNKGDGQTTAQIADEVDYSRTHVLRALKELTDEEDVQVKQHFQAYKWRIPTEEQLVKNTLSAFAKEVAEI